MMVRQDDAASEWTPETEGLLEALRKAVQARDDLRRLAAVQDERITDLLIRARAARVPVPVISGASGIAGSQVYARTGRADA